MSETIYRESKEIDLQSDDELGARIQSELEVLSFVLKTAIKKKFGWPIKTLSPLVVRPLEKYCGVDLGDGVLAACFVRRRGNKVKLQLGVEVE